MNQIVDSSSQVAHVLIETGWRSAPREKMIWFISIAHVPFRADEGNVQRQFVSSDG